MKGLGEKKIDTARWVVLLWEVRGLRTGAAGHVDHP